MSQRALPENWEEAGFGIYLHWPFCQAKCPYCDFNSHVSASTDQDHWRAAYLSEIDRIAEETAGRTVSSVFFGGGTPSLMDPSVVAAVLDRIASRWVLAKDFEATLEANPTSVEFGKFHDLAAGGVNRVSIGVQALNDRDLKTLGRMHSADDALQAVASARQHFERVSFDLIYARQNQSLADWDAELTRALSFGPDHLSLYQLTIEPGTPFGQRHRHGGLQGLPSEDLGADLFELTQEVTTQAGVPAYEVSNHARPGEEARHNLIYWRAGDWAGIGPGAHGRLTFGSERLATTAPRAPEAWLNRVRDTGNGELSRKVLTPEERGEEYVITSLRLAEGLSVDRLRGISDVNLNPFKIRGLQDIGVIAAKPDRITATTKGRALLNTVVAELLS